MGAGEPSPLLDLELRAVARALAERSLSPVELMDAVLDRIEVVEPVLNAFRWRNPEARTEAKRAEAALRRGEARPLLGVPITVKDLLLTRAAPTTAGSRTFGQGLVASADALALGRLLRAGAILVGKTSLHEIAMGVTTINEHFGPTRNPWDPERIAGGSSGGSAVAIAAGMGFASVGTDTRGSIRIPAACTGITGLKPTRDLVPTRGVIPLSWSLDHVGPMARSAADAALLLGIMVGDRGRAAAWRAASEERPPRYRIGVCEWFWKDVDPEIAITVREAIAALERAGHAVQEVPLSGLDEAHGASGVITQAEALAYHADRLATNPDGFGPLVRERLAHGRERSALELVRAERTRLEVAAAFRAAFRVVDCLATPALPALPPPIADPTLRIGGRELSVLEGYTRLNSPANMAGVPALGLPCGTSATGLPIGLQLIAAAGRETTLFALGAELQRATDWHRRRPPVEAITATALARS